MSTKFTTGYLKSIAASILSRKNVGIKKKLHGTLGTRVPAAPTAIPLHKIIMRLPKLFPRSVDASTRDYKDFCYHTGQLQEELLRTLPFYPYCAESKKAEVVKTTVDDQGNYINEFCITPVKPSVPSHKMKHLICIHGYGAGLGFFLKNLEGIPLLDNSWVIHAIDLPGYGFSSRPKFPFKYPKDSLSQVHSWFHDRIHTWFKKRGLLVNSQNNLVMAHSLGAYLMALYTTKYTTHFKKLVMCSPAGVCKSTTAKNIGNTTPPWWYTKLWDLNISPFCLVRNAAALGSMVTSGWSYRRFNKLLQSNSNTNLDRLQFEALHRYAYAIFNRRGSGEYLLSFALSCGGDPRLPLEDTIFKDKTSGIFRSNCEWIWIYGERDWMDVNGGERVSRFIENQGGRKSQVHVAPNSGHHLYFDNHKFFNSFIVKQMKDM
ncbi:ZYRO0C06270p [Zygosaccharomyces rouxii]|uniref:ZYRO0C06270p n=1 Tax=Zygosaccharomyces rouxii (strain ATCC 2623 / CBS 732 / NBRC 1130 / NCYC 568 / NRRL Y-229) TaxID=559307 RepID=C5DT80_ZYGRC|nr:uncharacterized protein ZYRO0C06270g [Zygosaccharomyces rouxii]KAH9201827.1 Alpha/Beta hydrolase protein [Zygosaccharomyces rouxii]CAR26991.1 ZYRO0C06270p [Zygosaccharomyces rouxii]